MKTKYFILLFILSVLVYSCTIESSGNGKLDGYWKLASIDTIYTGKTLTLTDKRLYWSVESKLLDLHDADGIHSHILVRFNNTGDSLLLSSPYGYDRENGDTLLTDYTVMQPYGINSLYEHFKILKLNGSDMVLQSSTLILHLEQY